MLKGKRTIWIYLLLPLVIFAQQSGEYTRKSITFLDDIVLASPSSRDMSIKKINYTAQSVKRSVQLERFDYNPLPKGSGLTAGFERRIRQADQLDVEAIADIMNATFVADIIKIIDENAEQRASELVDETAKMSFITTKAKDLGITAENLEQVFNSGYIYLPFINGYSETLEAKENDEKEMKYTTTISINGGILWFKINYDNGQTTVVPLLKKETSSSGLAVKNSADDSNWAAFTAAANNYARNLEVATKEIEDFKLRTQVVEVTGAQIGFNMGRKEGVHVDDRYVLGELVMSSNGQLSFKQDGFARVGKVGDNRSNAGELSYGYGVIVGDWAPGMTLVEYPTLPLDIYGMAGTLPLGISDDDADLRSNFAIAAEIAYNISHGVGTPGWYITAGAALGNATYTDDDRADSLDAGMSYFDISVMKRFQLRRLDGYIKGGAAYFGTSITDPGANDVTWTFSNEAFGGVVGGGLNLTLNLDMAIGLRYSYYFGSSDTWTVKNDDDADETEYDDFEMATDYTGAAIMLQFIYTPKALGFDPLAAAANLAN